MTRQADQTNRKALTLIELLIVMAVMVILASISMGAMKSLLRGQKVSQAAVSVRQYLQNAQVRAIASGRPVAVFFDRMSMTGVGASPSAANYGSMRLQLGEVFPPYSGDVEGTFGKLVDLAVGGSGYATAVVFEPTQIGFTPVNAVENVSSGIGIVSGGNVVGGFVGIGDVIEFDDCQARFSISAIQANSPSPGCITVLFTNPQIARQLPLQSGNNVYKRFRIYRQPTRSLVGSIVLPRGTCVDFSLSGVGVGDSSISNGTFHLAAAPDSMGTATPSDFSRLGIVFHSDGKIGYLMDENRLGALSRTFVDASGLIYLMIGRTDQILPGFPATNMKVAALQHPDHGASDLPKSNLVDPENVWITCNPLTGEIKSCPVAALDMTVVQTRWLSAQSNVNEVVSDLVYDARSLAVAGMSN